MDIGKKQQIMVDWFRKTLDESKKPWNTQSIANLSIPGNTTTTVSME